MTQIDVGSGSPESGAVLPTGWGDAMALVMDCEVHEGYRVEHREWEEIDWESDLSPTPAVGLQEYLRAGPDLELIAALHFAPMVEGPEVTEYVGMLADGNVCAAVSLISGGDPVRWTVGQAALCTLEIVPEEEPETYEPDGDDDVFEH